MKYNLAVFAIIVLVVFGASYLVFNLQKEKPVEKSYASLCQGYPIVKNETNISQTICEQAINIALNRYPGEVESVSKGQPRIGNETKDAWLVRISLDKPLGSGDNKLFKISVAVGLYEAKIIGLVK